MSTVSHDIREMLAVRQARRDASRYRPLSMAVGGGAALLIHVLMIGSMTFGAARRAHETSRQGLGADAVEADNEVAATLIFVEEPSIHPADSLPVEKVASHGKAEQSGALRILSPDKSISHSTEAAKRETEDASAAAASTGDRRNQARLFGLYIGQIQARIERAWQRPDVTPGEGEDDFDCVVQVSQDRHGAIVEVTLLECPATTPWQTSLVTAIQRASPLPAPPDASVFAESLQLTFHAAAAGHTRT